MPAQIRSAGQRRGFHRHRETGDDVGAVAGDRGLRHRLDRAVIGAGVVFGDPHDQAGDDQADQRAPEQRHAGEGAVAHLEHRVHADHPAGGEPDRRDRQNGGGDHALVHRPHDIAVGAETDEEGADDRGDDADAADDQRVGHQLGDQRRIGHEEDRGQHHGGDGGHRIGLEQVGGHAGAVADIVADIVSDGGRIARVILGNAGFDLADHVATDVGALGEDAAAETGEDRDQRGAEAQRDQRVDHLAAADGDAHVDQRSEVADHAQESETRHQHAGDRPRLEGEVEALPQALLCRHGGTYVGAYRHVHADEAGGAGEHRADQEADGCVFAEQDGEQHEHDDADDGNRGVLAAQIGGGALLYGLRDLLHARSAGVGGHNPRRGNDPIQHGDHAAAHDGPKNVRHFF